MLCRKGIQCADVNVADGIAFAGADGGQMAAGNDGQRPIAAQRAGLLILLLIIAADGVQQLLLFFPTGVTYWLVTSSRGRKNGTGQKMAPGVPSRSGSSIGA